MEIIEGGITSPKGFKAGGVEAGIKSNRKDMAAIYSDIPANVAGVFTQNIVQAAPVIWDKNIVDNYEKSQLIIINAGIANASTGKQGMLYCDETVKKAAEIFDIQKDNILLASTGVIGQQLPMDKISNGIVLLKEEIGYEKQKGTSAAQAIMTTDTVKKEIAVKIEIDNKKVTIGGVCKGSGMIHPNMCTMLGFITTDLNISKSLLNEALQEIVNDTFNMISVDGDTSTNDTVLVMANGLAGNEEINSKNENYDKFKEALRFVSEYLAKRIAEDGEGATKLFEVKVEGASSDKQARVIAKSVITSNLTKTALFGNDANWGRILCAMGYSGEKFEPEKVDLKFSSTAGELDIVIDGIATNYSEEKATEILSQKEVRALINIHEGQFEATAWGCDLTYKYVEINGDYRS
ncbi:bifunctional glutamate N-acetyltransferase/amino-acid acetyltransferase ArgJ [Miniphocaeibacter massiliensis]|uniref:bifunctional glutamate N-acetyltransferase/amino-acid acetyltransferase ArgJ n=1 Tax=Miniphocaeibacter massiliensis TaxID=2041841 RepID=UPI000C069430|nr:bifunctional glutamate N-acetyltransferase/amino-acid acetyltransferase ArgJ [Miniphocaeibacter massiliensis]